MNGMVCRLTDLILDSIINIRRELKFFEDVASRYALNISVPPGEESQGVKLYRSLFFGTAEGVEAGSVSMVEALVVLWGTEKVCLPLPLPPTFPLLFTWVWVLAFC
jgi:hypothetical protein